MSLLKRKPPAGHPTGLRGPLVIPDSEVGRITIDEKGPLLCGGLHIESEKLTPEIMAEWLLHYEKCMKPPAVIVIFTCPNNHSGPDLKCDFHASSDIGQYCGYCMDAGLIVSVTISVVYRF